MSLADERLSAARAAIAGACLDALPEAELGRITLRPGQRRIVARADRALRRHGGCLIGEDVGRGKTFIALALARRWRQPMVVAPATLRSTWAAAQVRAGAACEFISHEALSRRRVPFFDFDALIVDESHHFRNPVTARYETLARLSAAVPIVLLSATPLQNRTRDLAAQIALFYGERAFGLSAELLARFVIRGEEAERDDMPAVAAPEWLPVDVDDGAVLAALLDLPPPPRPLDGGDAGALRTIALVRAWASSRAALKGMLRSRRRLATAIAQGVEIGRTPTRRETVEWRATENVVQLGLAELLVQRAAHPQSVIAARAQLEAEDVGYDRVRAALAASVNPDASRIAAIRMLRASHPGCRIVAFSEYATTVSAYFDALRRDPGVGMITARHARIVTGNIPRDEMLERFAPRAQGAVERASHDAVTLLLATDIVSEGVNLQDASIVLHLDLPWNPARLAQRVGRVRRPGGADTVRSYLLAPPAQADELLAADARLRRKLDQARQAIGATFAVLPLLACTSFDTTTSRRRDLDSAVAEGELVEVLQRWAAESPGSEGGSEILIGAVTSTARGWLAALCDGRLIAGVDHAPSETVGRVLALVENAGGPARDAADDEVARAHAALATWIASERLLIDCGVGGDDAELHRSSHALLGNVIRAARRHEQPVLIGLASRIRHHLASPMPLGAERALLRRLDVAATRPALLAQGLAHALIDLDTSARLRTPVARMEHAPRVVAMIVVGPAQVDDGKLRV